MSLEQEILTIINQIPAAIEKAFMDVFVLRHPGHGNQKVHGNRFGAGQAKESLRRLKDDKGAREQYKQRFRERKKASGSTSITEKEAMEKVSKLSPYASGGYRAHDKRMQIEKLQANPAHAKEAIAYAEARTGRPFGDKDLDWASMVPEGVKARNIIEGSIGRAKKEIDFYKRQVEEFDASQKGKKKPKENPYKFYHDKAVSLLKEQEGALGRLR